jgi:hypothetical protein
MVLEVVDLGGMEDGTMVLAASHDVVEVLVKIRIFGYIGDVAIDIMDTPNAGAVCCQRSGVH